MEVLGKVHRLYVAADVDDVVAVVAQQFKSFTLCTAIGGFQGKVENTVIVEIASETSDLVVALGEELCRVFRQEGVGYVVDGVYSRILAQGVVEGHH